MVLGLPTWALGEPAVSVSTDRVPVGGVLLVTYEQRFRRAAQVERFELQLVLRESVTYSRLAETYTTEHEDVVFGAAMPGRRFERGEVFRQEYDVRVPVDAMHTFATRSGHNRIDWCLRLCVELAGQPTLRRSYPIIVLAELAG